MREESRASAIESTLMGGLVAIAMVAALTMLGIDLSAAFDSIADTLCEGAVSACNPM